MYDEDPGTEIFVDNTGCISLAKEARFHARTKHIDVHYHFVCECIEDGTLKIIHLPSIEMLADGLTKPLLRLAFQKMIIDMDLLPD